MFFEQVEAAQNPLGGAKGLWPGLDNRYWRRTMALHWTLAEIIRGLIGLLLGGMAVGVTYIAVMITKVPIIEQGLTEHIVNHKQEQAQHQQQMIAIRLSIFKLREGTKLDINDLKDLLSDVRAFSRSVPQLIEEVVIEEGKQPVSTKLPAVAAAFPGIMIPDYPRTIYPLTDPDDIAKFIEAALTSAARVEWSSDLDSKQIHMSYPDGMAIIRPRSFFSIDDANALSARLNIARETVLKVTARVAGDNTEKPNQDIHQTP